MMATKSLVRRITAALGALDAAGAALGRLEAARRLREAAEELEAAEVEAARKAGVTWNEIGACYGLTKQGAQQRFRAARDQAKGVTAVPEKEEGRPARKTGRSRGENVKGLRRTPRASLPDADGEGGPGQG